jgi:hypothetical protein
MTHARAIVRNDKLPMGTAVAAAAGCATREGGSAAVIE